MNGEGEREGKNKEYGGQRIKKLGNVVVNKIKIFVMTIRGLINNTVRLVRGGVESEADRRGRDGEQDKAVMGGKR